MSRLWRRSVSGETTKPEPRWDGSFAANSAEQRRRWAEETTPGERLAWLEEALRFAQRAGALESGRTRPTEER